MSFNPEKHETPPEAVLNRTPTLWDTILYPHYYMAGPGRGQAENTRCDHKYFLTDSCPGCDMDKERMCEALDVARGR